MSDIFGVFRFDGGPASEPERVVFVDARLDYREELERKLELEAGQGDEDLLLAAWRRWGEDCVNHLYGDFAFAIWDEQARSLFCARDHFGLRPLYYHHAPGTLVAIASDARDIFAVPEIPFAINRGRIADFVVPELEWNGYSDTFYEGVYRLPPGHRITITPERLELDDYGDKLTVPELGPMSDDDWRHGFLEVFERAVAERINGNVGSMLSGGMDSGSVAAVAQSILGRDGMMLSTYSAARPAGIDCDESNRIRATAKFIGANSVTVEPDAIEAMDADLASSLAEPFDGEFLFMKAIYMRAAQDGVDVLLDGGAGDVIFNEGTYVPRLIRRGKLSAAWREITAESRNWGGSVITNATRYLGKALGPAVLKNWLRPQKQKLLARRYIGRSLIDPEFAQDVDIQARCQDMYTVFPGEWTSDYAFERIRKIRPNVCAGRERYARLAWFAGIEARDPFLDRRVVDFCSRLPGHLLLRDGWYKAILRDVMANRLPDEVRWGLGKPHIGWTFNESFIGREISRGRLSLDALLVATEGYLEPAKLRHSWREFKRGGDHEPVHSAYFLSLWLQQSVKRPVVNKQGFS